MERFYWVAEGLLAGCCKPGGRFGRSRRDSDALSADLEWLWTQGIRAIISLTEDPLPAGILEAHGFQSIHIPVIDMTAPSPAQIEQALAFVDTQAARGNPVVAHCLMGQGRTGTVLAAWLIRGGMPASAAIGEVRAICPGAIESESQVRALHSFDTARSWIV